MFRQAWRGRGFNRVGSGRVGEREGEGQGDGDGEGRAERTAVEVVGGVWCPTRGSAGLRPGRRASGGRRARFSSRRSGPVGSSGADAWERANSDRRRAKGALRFIYLFGGGGYLHGDGFGRSGVVAAWDVRLPRDVERQRKRQSGEITGRAETRRDWGGKRENRGRGDERRCILPWRGIFIMSGITSLQHRRQYHAEGSRLRRYTGYLPSAALPSQNEVSPMPCGLMLTHSALLTSEMLCLFLIPQETSVSCPLQYHHRICPLLLCPSRHSHIRTAMERGLGW